MRYIEKIHLALNAPDSRLVFVQNDKSYNAEQIKYIVELYIAYLEGLGLHAGDRIAIVPSRTVEWTCFFFALQLLGVIPLIIDRLIDPEIKNQLSEKCQYIFADSESLEHLDEGKRIQFPNPDVLSSEEIVSISELAIPENDELFSCHTSGTTGTPKVVTYTEENILWALDAYYEVYELSRNSTILFSLPFHYCYSVIPCCIVPVLFSKKIIFLPEEYSIREIAQLIHDQHINVIAVVPTFYKKLVDLDLSAYDFRSLRICDSGGESIPSVVLEKFREQTNAIITEGYGLTETTSLTHFLKPDTYGNLRFGSVGKALHQVECRIIDDLGGDVNVGEIGELLLKGPMVIDGYDDASLNQASFHEGWFKTGDLFYADSDHYYYLVCRKKDATHVDNELHLLASREVPRMLQFTFIKDVTYRFLNNDELAIFIVADTTTTDNEIDYAVRSSVASKLFSIATIHRVSKLPRTGTGKVMKGSL